MAWRNQKTLRNVIEKIVMVKPGTYKIVIDDLTQKELSKLALATTYRDDWDSQFPDQTENMKSMRRKVLGGIHGKELNRNWCNYPENMCTCLTLSQAKQCNVSILPRENK